MKFEKIILQNMFSYYGEVSFDLTGGDSSSNIVLISGRNGYGKTSFIRSLTLLFSGTEQGLVSAVSGRKMGQKLFVTGDGKNWLGVLNRKAAKEKKFHCSVRIEWIESLGRVTATRSWNIHGNNFLGDLEIQFNDTRMTDKSAKEFLDQRLPSAYIPFFFFDSEQIEKLADSTDESKFREQMERLLDIAPIDLLREELATVAKEWQRDSMEKKERLVLFELQNRFKEKELSVSMEDEKQADLEYQKEELEQTISILEKEKSSLEDIQGRQDLDRLKKKRSETEDSRGEYVAMLTDAMAKDSPLLANSVLVKKTIRYLEKAAESPMGAAAEILESLKKSLVTGLLDEPPYPNPELIQGQKDFLKKRLVGLIEARIPDRDTGLFTLDTRKAKQLYEIFISFKGMDYKRTELQRLLTKIHELTNEVAAIDFQMAEATGFTDEERERISSLEFETRNKIEALGAVKESLNQSQGRKNAFLKEIQKIRTDISSQEKAVDLSQRAKSKVNLARDLRSFFDEYKNRLRKMRKEDVEDAFNKYLRILMPEHHLVDHVVVEDSFSLTYMGKDGGNVGRTSLSSGMKQLIATALLWALKTVSGKDVPVVIDTPLGRLDYGHQVGLLEKYYPEVGNQVILLPTDSEIDEAKYKIILPHVYKEYRLKNDDGESATAVETVMYPAV